MVRIGLGPAADRIHRLARRDARLGWTVCGVRFYWWAPPDWGWARLPNAGLRLPACPECGA